MIFLCPYGSLSREGMYMPQLLKQFNEKEMQSMGMMLSADDIYSESNPSLKDAVLLFGQGCTGEVISSNGLFITNHHCGFSQIQSLSTMERNLLEDGFWAASNKEEIPCPGLTVTFIKSISEVTEIILSGISDTLSERERAAIIRSRTDSLERSDTTGIKSFIRSFYQGNRYYLFVAETFSDIRLVGAPPRKIGKFGGETDNWMWPRHTGDFALFRIYANAENKPAKFSETNVPYRPIKHFPINITGVAENDFIMVMGFPGRTTEYMPSPGIKTVIEQTNPNRIAIREARLDILRDEIRRNDTIRLKYASKFSTLENSYKKWKGELLGLDRLDVLNRKEHFENDFLSRLRFNDPDGDHTLISQYAAISDSSRPLMFANDYFAEGFPGLELISVSARLRTLSAADTIANVETWKSDAQKLITDLRGFYKNFDKRVDERICKSILTLAADRLQSRYLPKQILEARENNRLDQYIESLYQSLLADSTRAIRFLSGFKKSDAKKIRKDPAYNLSLEIGRNYRSLTLELASVNSELSVIQRRYMHELMRMDTSGLLYPDANLTLRVSYGRVEGMKPRDGMRYEYYTTIDGILQKSKMGIDDYQIPKRLGEIIEEGNYGNYATDNSVRVAFTASAHTTGGNSGSPVLNAKGELVGVNYDRVWEGVMSDYYYSPEYSRNISLDMRYVLFIIEKYGGAGHLIKEMTLVR